MSDLRTAAQAALDALNEILDDVFSAFEYEQQYDGFKKHDERIAAYVEQLEKHKAAIAGLEAALAQQSAVQEPVAKYIGECPDGSLVQLYDDLRKGVDLYAAPQQAPDELEALQADAARYRWLRDNASIEQAEKAWLAAIYKRGGVVDAAIDAAKEQQ